MAILFYSTRGKFGAFSNFSRHGVELDDLWWKTTEHYFQAQKFLDAEYKEKIRTAPDPKTAANQASIPHQAATRYQDRIE